MRTFGFMTSGLLLLTVNGCYFEYFVPPPTAQTNHEIASTNVANLKTLALGQSREDVLQRMKADPVKGCVEWSWAAREYYLRHNGYLRCVRTGMILSPYRTAKLERNGVHYDVLYYYTGGTDPEGGITDQQLTPVVIENDRLAGWGWTHPLVKDLNLAPSATPTSSPPPAR